MGNVDSLVLVFGARVDKEAGQHTIAELVLGEHAAHRLVQHSAGVFLQLVLERDRVDTARETAEAMVDLVMALVAGDIDTVGIDEDHEVAAIDVGSIVYFALAGKDSRKLGREAAQNLALRIVEVVFAIDGFLRHRFRQIQ